MRKNYKLNDGEFKKIVGINKLGGDPVICFSGGIPIGKSLQEKINDFWIDLGEKYGFNWETVEGINNIEFSAEIKQIIK